MNPLAGENKGQTTRGHSKLGFWAFVIIVSMVGIELINAVRIWSNPPGPSRFPYNYVSKGIWSFGSFLRPLDSDSGDFSPPLIATYNAFHGNVELYSDFKLEGSIFPYPPTAVIELFGFAYVARPPEFSGAFKLADLIGRFCVLATIAIAAWLLRAIVVSKREWFLAILILGAFFFIKESHP